jgi:hypothetical protein
MLHFDDGYVTCLYVPFYFVGDACTEYVAILLANVSFLARCHSLCLFEKYMLAFVALIHAFPTKGRQVHKFITRGSTFLHQRGEMHLFKWILHSSKGSSLCRLNFSCALSPMVSSPFCLTLRRQQFWSILSPLCRAVALALGDRDCISQVILLCLLSGIWSLVWDFGWFLFFFYFF